MLSSLKLARGYEPRLAAHNATPPRSSGPSYILTSFQDGAVLGDGLRLLVSQDALHWSELQGSPLLLPLEKLRRLGAKVFRDPSIVFHGGRFHLVFTSDLCVDQVYGHWQCRRHSKSRPVARFGYAHSRDLVRWEGARLVDAPVHDACSLWAPEASVLPPNEGGGLLVVFTVTQSPGLCPSSMRESDHRPYYVISRDFKHFSKPKPLRVHSGQSIIDMFPLLQSGGAAGGGARGNALVAANPESDHESDHEGDHEDGGASAAGGKHLLFYKAETNLCGPPYEAPLEWAYGSTLYTNASCSLVLRVARAHKATGEWLPDPTARGAFFTDAISRPCVEGPTVVRSPDGAWILLFDNYRSDCVLVVPQATGPCTHVGEQVASDIGLRPRHLRSEAHHACLYEPARLGFGALRSSDLATWTDITGRVHVPPFHKHGTAMRLTPRAWQQVCEEVLPQSPFELVCLERQSTEHSP